MADIPTTEEIRAIVSAAVEPLRLEIEKLRSDRSQEPVPIPEAARRLNRSVRWVQEQLKRGELEAVQVGGSRYVRLPGAPRAA